jgi:hypothetical protein
MYAKYSVETLRGNTMKNIIKSIYTFLCACGKAKYAAELARNGKIKQAQACYR